MRNYIADVLPIREALRDDYTFSRFNVNRNVPIVRRRNVALVFHGVSLHDAKGASVEAGTRLNWSPHRSTNEPSYPDFNTTLRGMEYDAADCPETTHQRFSDCQPHKKRIPGHVLNTSSAAD